jgi:virginiamycin A acetyltransferase
VIKQVAKRVADLLATVLVAIPYVLYRLEAVCVGEQFAFPGWSQLFALLPGQIGVYCRRAFYRQVFPRCGRDVCISFGTVFSHPTAVLGDRVYIGVGCMIGDVTIDDDALVGSHVSIINGRRQHGIERLDIPVREQAGDYPRVVIGRDAWIGDRAVVTEHVGVHACVGAAAVVTKPVPDYAIVVGNPATVRDYRGPQISSMLTGVTSEIVFAPTQT